MSDEEDTVWFTIAEKALGLLVILIGAIIVYSTVTSPKIALPESFIAGGLVMIVIGALMFISRVRE